MFTVVVVARIRRARASTSRGKSKSNAFRPRSAGAHRNENKKNTRLGQADFSSPHIFRVTNRQYASFDPCKPRKPLQYDPWCSSAQMFGFVSKIEHLCRLAPWVVLKPFWRLSRIVDPLLFFTQYDIYDIWWESILGVCPPGRGLAMRRLPMISRSVEEIFRAKSSSRRIRIGFAPHRATGDIDAESGRTFSVCFFCFVVRVRNRFRFVGSIHPTVAALSTEFS